LQSSLESVLHDSELVVVGHDPSEFKQLRELLRPDQIVVRLSRQGGLACSQNFDGSTARP
jgi:hypothetical protein